MQEEGEATYLLAWRGDELAGRCSVLAASKYEQVRRLLGASPEMNALQALPPGKGTGTQLIAYAEDMARAAGAAAIGLAVEVSNQAAKRLYLRLGYLDWGRGLVVDQWAETDSAGKVLRTNADSCDYLVKQIDAPGATPP
jgi:GNAT superfamily N-acetyltransferase